MGSPEGGRRYSRCQHVLSRWTCFLPDAPRNVGYSLSAEIVSRNVTSPSFTQSQTSTVDPHYQKQAPLIPSAAAQNETKKTSDSGRGSVTVWSRAAFFFRRADPPPALVFLRELPVLPTG